MKLAEAQTGGDAPPFTASFGLTVAHPTQPIDEVLREADAALSRSKHDGRNRVTIAGEPDPAARSDD